MTTQNLDDTRSLHLHIKIKHYSRRKMFVKPSQHLHVAELQFHVIFRGSPQVLSVLRTFHHRASHCRHRYTICWLITNIFSLPFNAFDLSLEHTVAHTNSSLYDEHYCHHGSHDDHPGGVGKVCDARLLIQDDRLILG